MKSLNKLLLLACCCISISGYAQQTGTDEQPIINAGKTGTASCCANGNCCNGTQTPLGVTTDHTHAKGEWSALYTYQDLMMQGNRTGTSITDDNTLYQKYNYMMAPETMTMQMHMAMLMYGVTDRLTVMAMGGYMVSNMTMNMNTAMPSMPGMVMPAGSTTMQSMSSGFTDTKLSALYNFSKQANQRIIGGIGVSIPTGTIMATGTTMLGDNQRLPYDMQPGTGSFSVVPDITYIRQAGKFQFGGNAGADIKLDKNSLGYKLGNVYYATAWASYKFLPFVSGSLRAEGIIADKISGSDPQVDIPVYEEYDPTTSTNHYGGSWGNMYAGLNFHVNKPVLNDFQLQLEYGMPVYENLNGPQMSVHSNLLAGLQYRF